MKRILIILALCSLNLCLRAESGRKPLLTETMQNAVIYQDSTITQLLNQIVNSNQMQLVQIDGYRVQVYSSNRQQTAKVEAMQIEKNLTGHVDVPIYVQYTPPFWKVRLGNYRTKEEAMNYKNEFVKLHPELQGETYIVRDQIEVLQ